MPKLTLYGPPRIPFLIKVRLALAWKKLPYEWVVPDGPEDFKKYSPRTGLLPALHIDGDIIEDSSVILDELQKRFPEPSLVAADPKIARSQIQLERWSEAAFMFYWIHYLQEVAATGKASPGTGGLADEFSQRLDDLVNFLGGRPFFYADEPSRADFSVFGFLGGVGIAVGEDVAAEVASRPALAAHLARIGDLTGVRVADEP